MKRLIAIALLAPSTVLAHGVHAPVPETAHGMAHAGLDAGLIIIAAVALVSLVGRVRK